MSKNFWYHCFEMVPILVSPTKLHSQFHCTFYNHSPDFIAALYPRSKSIPNLKLLKTYKSALLPLLKSFRTCCWRSRFPYSFSLETRRVLFIARGTLLLLMDYVYSRFYPSSLNSYQGHFNQKILLLVKLPDAFLYSCRILNKTFQNFNSFTITVRIEISTVKYIDNYVIRRAAPFWKWFVFIP